MKRSLFAVLVALASVVVIADPAAALTSGQPGWTERYRTQYQDCVVQVYERTVATTNGPLTTSTVTLSKCASGSIQGNFQLGNNLPVWKEAALTSGTGNFSVSGRGASLRVRIGWAEYLPSGGRVAGAIFRDAPNGDLYVTKLR